MELRNRVWDVSGGLWGAQVGAPGLPAAFPAVRPVPRPGDSFSPSPPLSARSSQPLGTRTSALSPLAGLGSGRHSAVAITCGHEEDAGTQDDVVSSLVELAGCDAESTHEKQNHTQDREDARGPHGPCRTWRVRERERTGL